MSLRRLAISATAILAAASLALSAGTAQATDMAAHRAIYTLHLDSEKTGSSGDVSGATGTMAYEVQDVCDGWASRQRLDMTVTNRDGQDVRMLSDYTTWESKDGLQLHFRMKQTTGDNVTSDVAGDAALDATGGAGTAHYTSPEETTKDLPAGTLFPTMHTAALLKAAAEGKKFLALPLFDGTSAGGAQDSSIVISGWTRDPVGDRPELKPLPSGRFHIAFFDRDAEHQQPDYEVSMRYWDNGVADDLSMDFGDFVMAGKLSEFKLIPGKC